MIKDVSICETKKKKKKKNNLKVKIDEFLSQIHFMMYDVSH